MIHTGRAERDSLGFRVLEIEADLSETEIETQFASRANGIMDIFRSRQVQAFLARPKTKNQISADHANKGEISTLKNGKLGWNFLCVSAAAAGQRAT